MDQTRFTLTGSRTNKVAVSLERIASCNLHAGIVYRYRRRLRRVHFAWHKRLESSDYKGELACAMPELDPADESWLAKFFQRIARNKANKDTIPYNLKHDATVEFNEDTGEVSLGVDSTGLGCATFVIAAFRSGGHPLIDPTAWPPATAQDRARRQVFIDALRQSSDLDKQAQGHRIAPEIDSPCMAPQHVAGACLESADDRPVAHPTCKVNGDYILSVLP